MKTQELTHVLRVYVPTHLTEAVAGLAATHFGGYTAYAAQGGWQDGNRKLVKDDINVVEVYAIDKAGLGVLMQQAAEALMAAGEAAVLAVLDGTAYMMER